MTKRVKIQNFPRTYGEDMLRRHKILRAACILAARKNMKHVIQSSPSDLGHYRNAHKVEKIKDGAILANRTP